MLVHVKSQITGGKYRSTTSEYDIFHSYGRIRAPNWEEMDAAGRAYNTALQRVYGLSYFVGQSGQDLCKSHH